MILAAFAVLAFAVDDSTVVEESLATFAPPVTPDAVATPTASAEPTAATPTAQAGSSPDQVATEWRVDGDQVANTDPEGALLDAFYVPNFAAAVDRTAYDADVSAPLATATPAPAVAPPEPASAPVQPHRTATPTPEVRDEPPADPPPDRSSGDDRPDPVEDTDDEPDDGGGGPSPSQWAALRACESGGNYGAVSPSGAYRGAYQFSQGTWDAVTSGAFPNLVGVDPAEASPAQQDRVAERLYALRGAAPWPTCGRHLL